MKPQVKVDPEMRGETNVVTGLCRIAFAHLLEAGETLNEGEFKYSCVLLFEPSDPTLPLLRKAAAAAAKRKWTDKLPQLQSSLRNPIRDGNEKEYQGFAGHVYVSCSAKNRPGVVDAALKKITSDSPDADGIYSGCWVRADINAFAYEQKGNRGVSFGLNNVQKLGDDEPFSGRKSADQVFAPVALSGVPAAAADDDEAARLFG
jgi:hypothetical protein